MKPAWASFDKCALAVGAATPATSANSPAGISRPSESAMRIATRTGSASREATGAMAASASTFRCYQNYSRRTLPGYDANPTADDGCRCQRSAVHDRHGRRAISRSDRRQREAGAREAREQPRAGDRRAAATGRERTAALASRVRHLHRGRVEDPQPFRRRQGGGSGAQDGRCAVARSTDALDRKYRDDPAALHRRGAEESALRDKSGGGRGIRTPGTVSGTVVFKTTAIDRSAIPPPGHFIRKTCSRPFVRRSV